jgi:hypothetical protein
MTDAERERKDLKKHIASIMGKEYTPMDLQRYLCGLIEAPRSVAETIKSELSKSKSFQSITGTNNPQDAEKRIYTNEKS